MANPNKIDFEAFLTTRKFISELNKIEREVLKVAKSIETSFTPAIEKADKQVLQMRKDADQLANSMRKVANSAKDINVEMGRAASSMSRASKSSGGSRGSGGASGSSSAGSVMPWDNPFLGDIAARKAGLSAMADSGIAQADEMLAAIGEMDDGMEGLGITAVQALGMMDDAAIPFLGRLGSAGSSMAGLGQAAGATAGTVATIAVAAAGITAVIAGAVVAMKAMYSISKMVYEEFIKITDQAQEAAIQIDTAQEGFLSLFQGSEEMAGAAMDTVRQKSMEMGVDLTQLGRAFMPEMQSLEEFDKLAEVSAALARYDPAQGAYGVNLALKDAMTGDFRSLRQRLEFSVPETDRIRAHMEANGNSIISMLDAIEVELERKGRSWEAFADTYTTHLGRVQQGWKFLMEEMGAPVLDSQKEGLKAIGDIMGENMDLFVLFGESLGRMRGQIEEVKFAFYEAFIQVFVDNKDKVAAFLEATEKGIFIITETAKLVADALGTMFSAGEHSDGGALSFMFDMINNGLLKIAESFITLTVLARRFFTFMKDNLDAVIGAMDFEAGIQSQLESMGKIELFPADLITGTMSEVDFHMAKLKFGLTELEETWSEGMANIGKDTENAANAVTSAFLEMQQATQALAQAQADMENMTAEFRGEMAELTRESQQKMMDSMIQRDRDLMDLERDTSQKREDAYREHMQDIEDIHRKHGEKLADAARKNADQVEDAHRAARRREEDIRKDYERGILEDERDLNEKKIDIERKFRDKLAELRRKYEFDAEEAIRQNDAVALLRLRRKLQFDLNEARLAREKDKSGEDEAAQKKKADRKRRLQEELDDSRLARDRKLEDIQIGYERELEEARIALERKLAEQKLALERELEEIKIAEERKREEINLAHERRIEDIQRNMDRELEVLKKGLDAQVRVVEEAARRMAAAQSRMMNMASGGFLGSRGSTTRYQNYMATRGRGSRTGTGSYSEQVGDNAGRTFTPGPASDYTPTQHGGYGRRYGGTVFPGLPVMVGEPRPGNVPNPEIFIPSSLGRIFPMAGKRRFVGGMDLSNGRGMLARPPMMGTSNNYKYITEMNIDLSKNIMDNFNPVQMRVIENVFTQLMINAQRRRGTKMRRF
jgi:hypothetical protein